jgi:hypothetical protein
MGWPPRLRKIRPDEAQLVDRLNDPAILDPSLVASSAAAFN